jgi:peroxiredoxin
MILAPALGEPAPDITLLHTDGRPARLRELARGRPSVFHFVRHYG